MRNPKDFPKALAVLQVSEIIVYTVTAVIMYRFGGRDIKSPALGSAGPIISKIAYGLAIPTVRTPQAALSAGDGHLQDAA
jgi:hypothetical protein